MEIAGAIYAFLRTCQLTVIDATVLPSASDSST